jgi:phosphate transport system ATP-binding protein
LVEGALREVQLWDAVKDNLKRKATNLTLEQQQKLCIARLLPLKPKVILMDEPCSALDPMATLAIEELMRQLSEEYTIVIVTHNMQQASRASDWTGFFWLGRLIEFNNTQTLFTSPQEELTEAYITGRQG